MGRILFKDPVAGCQTIVFCACKDGIRDQSGKLFYNCKLQKIKDKGRDKQLSKDLWNKSLHLCHLDSEIVLEEEVVVTEKTDGQEVRSRDTAAVKAAEKQTKIPQQLPKMATEAPRKAPEPIKKAPEPAKKPAEVKKPEPVKQPQAEQPKKQPEVPPKPASKPVQEATE